MVILIVITNDSRRSNFNYTIGIDSRNIVNRTISNNTSGCSGGIINNGTSVSSKKIVY